MSDVATRRIRLVEAARTEFHKDGYSGASLASVARTAGIPPGNVFYYFKTKADLGHAVVDLWCAHIAEELDRLAVADDPLLRLKAYLRRTDSFGDIYVARGCPLAGFVRDLRQVGEPLASHASRIYEVQYAWLDERFAELGFQPSQCRQHSRRMMAQLQGAILLSYAQGDAAILSDEVARLGLWVDSLVRDETASAAS
jgi:AcrR family transcriptional regulator